jgi:hypothetical protein
MNSIKCWNVEKDGKAYKELIKKNEEDY